MAPRKNLPSSLTSFSFSPGIHQVLQLLDQRRTKTAPLGSVGRPHPRDDALKRCSKGPGGCVCGDVRRVALFRLIPPVEVLESFVGQALECFELGLQDSAVARLVVGPDLNELLAEVVEQGALDFAVVGIDSRVRVVVRGQLGVGDILDG